MKKEYRFALGFLLAVVAFAALAPIYNPSGGASTAYVDAKVTNDPYNGVAWQSDSTRAPTRQAIADKIEVLSVRPVEIGVALSDETTAITTGTAKVTIRAPYAFALTAVRASLTTASSSGTPTVDINESGTTVLSTKLTIDVSEKTSTTAAVPAVISDAAIADDAEITFDIDSSGTDAAGMKVFLIGHR